MMKTIVIFLIIVLLAVSVSLLIPGIRRAIFELGTSLTYGRLTIGNEPPVVEKIFMNSGGTYYECPDLTGANNCVNAPNEENSPSAKAITIYAQIYDPNGDCNSADTVNIYVCPNTTGSIGVCNAQMHDGSALTVSFLQQSGDNLRCNFSTTYNLDYFKRYGLWRINATALGASVYNSTMKYWINQLAHFYKYPVVGTTGGTDLIFGSLNTGQWYYGAAQNTSRNTGNTRFNISFRTNNFTSGANTIIIDAAYSDLYADNDTNAGNGESVQFDAMPVNTIWWFPNNGVRRCNNAACSQDEDAGARNQANYTIAYHIYLNSTAQTIPSGTYNNTFTINTNACEPSYTGLPCGSGY
jgi:hypothetical protein